MGLIERIEAGANFTREIITLNINPGTATKSGSTDAFGGTFVILNVTAQQPCRIRLYSDQSSMITDASRLVNDYNINEGVGLITDTVIDSSNSSLSFDPPVLGTTFAAGNVWYNLSGSVLTGNNITITAFPLAIDGDSTTDRSTLTVSGSSIASASYATGNITSPKSFLILTGSSTAVSRLRLYSTDISTVSATEISRSFNTTPSTGSNLIADLMFDTASYAYKLVPLLEAYTWNEGNYSAGTNVVGYVLKNETASPATITASLYIHSTEE